MPKDSFLPDLVSQSDFSSLTGWDRCTLWKHRKRGMPHYRSGGRLYYDPAEVEKWVLTKCRISKAKKKAVAGRK